MSESACQKKKKQIYNSVSVRSAKALQVDTTNHRPDVPTPHNSTVRNSTNPISAAAVSTAPLHSWGCHRLHIRPVTLVCCILVIAPKSMLIPKRGPPSPPPVEATLAFQSPVNYRSTSFFKEPDKVGSVTFKPTNDIRLLHNTRHASQPLG